MATIVILANSKRPDGQCVAGIDLDSGEWTRLVTRDSDAVPEERCFLGSHFLSLCDVLKVDLIPLPGVVKYQRENRIIHNWRWRVEGRLAFGDLAKYVDDRAPLFFSQGDRVAPSYLESLPPERWESLRLVRPRRLAPSPCPRGEGRWVAEFDDAAANRYRLKITDFESLAQFQRRRPSDDVLLTVSLTKPWVPKGGGKPPYCHKIVAAILDGQA